MPARILDGKAAAERVMARVKAELKAANVRPGFATVLVGADRAAKSNARLKHEACAELGFHSVALDLPAETPTEDIVKVIQAVGSTPQVHGVLLQFPLPESVDLEAVIAAIPPDKDVDASRPDTTEFVPATAAGVLELLEGVERRSHALVGESPLLASIGRLLGGAAVEVGEADIVVVGDGRPEGLIGKMIKKGAAVVDLGFHKVGGKVVGDVEARSVSKVASALTPVPGGVGPITVAMLMEHTLRAAKKAR